MQLQINKTSKIKVKPDLIQIHITINKYNSDYSSIFEDSTSSFNNLKEELVKLNIKKNNIKSDNISIRPKFEANNGYDVDKSKIKGYELNHQITVSIKNDNKLLFEIFNVLTKLYISSFYLTYSLKDENKYKNSCLKNAINQCKDKAKDIADNMNMKVEDIISLDVVDNFVSYLNFEQSQARAIMCTSDDVTTNYNFKEIEVSSTACMKFLLK